MIPVYDPWIGEEEAQAVKQAVLDGEISGSFGKSIPRFEETFAALTGCRHGVAVTSGTTALHLAVAACHFTPGDEILLSASTNIATALAIIHNGLVPVPIDSEPGTWNLDPDLIEELITARTRAIMPVHLFGHPVAMDRVNAIAKKHGLKVIEDCAESHGATWKGTTTGAFGDMGCFSFYGNKILTTGEGGVIVQYLADQKPQAGLIPQAGTEERYVAQECLHSLARKSTKTSHRSSATLTQNGKRQRAQTSQSVSRGPLKSLATSPILWAKV